MTDVLEIYIISLVNFDRYNKNTKNELLNKWVKFIKNPEGVDMSQEKNEAIKQAKEVLEGISQDERERYLADLREKYILDHNEAINTGLYRGKKIGEKQLKYLLQKN